MERGQKIILALFIVILAIDIMLPPIKNTNGMDHMSVKELRHANGIYQKYEVWDDPCYKKPCLNNPWHGK